MNCCFSLFRNGAMLLEVRDLPTQDYISNLVTVKGVSKYWPGLNTQATVLGPNEGEWADGTSWPLLQGFWSNEQPDNTAGQCVYVSKESGHFLWSFGTCEEKSSFVCQYSACEEVNFRCLSGECIPRGRVCNGYPDCPDISDEIDCPSLCRTYVVGGTGEISSDGFSNAYSPDTECVWTLEGPVGSVLHIQFTDFTTEQDRDEVLVLGGAKFESGAVLLSRLSGSLVDGSNNNNNTFRSSNNFMIVKFTSDDSGQLAGFKATWTAVQTSYPDTGVILTSQTFFQDLNSFGYPTDYLANQESVYIIKSQQAREILVLEVLDVDLADGDVIYIRDGVLASSPLLAQITSFSIQQRFYLSTGPNLRIFFKATSGAETTRRGFSFQYKTGCVVVLQEDNGVISSPGYPTINYANSLLCIWTVRAPSTQPLVVRIDSGQFGVHPSDTLQALVGTAPPLTVSSAPTSILAPDGRLTLRFETDAINNAPGFRATFSIGCPDPRFNPDTLVQPSLITYSYGDTVTVSCAAGFVFDSEEFYEDTPGGDSQSKASVQIECLFGGSWNVRTIPNCISKYCGLPSPIPNGYIQSATGVVYSSTVTYGCLNGYSIAGGQASVTCDQSGTWSSPPSCVVQQCPGLALQSTNAEAALTYKDGLAVGSIYTFTCPSGYQLSGTPILLCQASGTWSSALPTCQPRVCVIPSVPLASVQTTSQTAVVGDSLVVQCNTGYVVAGTQSITTSIICQADLTFGTLPTCVVSSLDYCSSNPCTVNQTCSSTIGTHVCSCRDGFTSDGNICLDDDECQAGSDGCSQVCVNQIPGYQCQCDQAGYSLYTRDGFNGFSIPTGETGLKAGDVYRIGHTCVCTIVNGYITNPQTSYHVNDTLFISCDLGFVPTGQVRSAVCSDNGQWSPNLPSCQVAQCPPDSLLGLNNPPSAVIPTGVVNFGQVVTLLCQVDGLDTFNRTRSCVFDPSSLTYRLQGGSLECGVVDCGPPEVYLPVGARAIFPTPENSTVFGSSFTFECIFPYYQTGGALNTEVTCQSNGLWDFGTLECIYSTCPDPGTPLGGSAIVNGYDFGSVASYSCSRIGFEPQPTAQLQCESTGVSINDTSRLRWSAETPTCVDTQSPQFPDCPTTSPFVVSRYSSAAFTAPTPTDNSGLWAESLVIPADFLPEQPIAEDVLVLYLTADYAGLSSGCFVTISVLDETPPLVECPTPVILEVSPNINASTTFTDQLVVASDNIGIVSTQFSRSEIAATYEDIGKVFDISATVFDGAGNNATCFFQTFVRGVKCSPDTLAAPPNTVKSCVATVSGGYNCTFICQAGFYFYDAYDNEEFVTRCEPGQDFSPVYIPACSESVPLGKVVSVLLDYDADIGTPVSDQCLTSYESQLGSTLTDLRSTLTSLCSAQGSIDSVQLKEGTIVSAYYGVILNKGGGRGRGRGGSSGTAVGYQIRGPGLESVSGPNQFFFAPLCPPSTKWVARSLTRRSNGGEESNNKLPHNAVLFQFELELLPFGATQPDYSACTDSIDTDFSLLPLGQGQVAEQLVNISVSLVQSGNGSCPNITASSASTSSADKCESDLDARTVGNETVCLKCPIGTTRNADGDSCILCPVGTYWVGSFNPFFGQCALCPPGFSTEREGTTGFEQCIVKCPIGTTRNADGDSCIMCPVGTYWVGSFNPFFGQCALCPPGFSTEREGTTGFEQCIAICAGNFASATGVSPCAECQGNTYRLNKTHCEECPLGTRALRDEDPLLSNCTATCEYDLVPQTTLGSLPKATYGLELLECERVCEAWDLFNPRSRCFGFEFDAARNVCLIHDSESAQQFSAIYDLYVRRCGDDNLEECYCAPQCPAGQYSETGHRPGCRDCPAGFVSNQGSTRCTECASNQTSIPGTDTCFDGNSTLCEPNPCQNGGECKVENHNAFCNCPDGTRGRFCAEIVDACLSSPCYYGGACAALPAGDFQCSCPQGTSGKRCEENINDCPPEECNGRGACIDGLVSFKCFCIQGFTGQRCESRLEAPCDRLACDPVGTDSCGDINDIYARCVCKPGYTGPTCSDNVDECISEPCQNGGTCVDQVASYFCACLPGFRGENCEITSYSCDGGSVCENATSCEDDYRTGLSMCVCSPGYTQGQYCTDDISYGIRLIGEIQTEIRLTLETCQIICNLEREGCAGFSFFPLDDPTAAGSGNCTLYSRIDSTARDVPDDVVSSIKSCNYYTDDTFFSPWLTATYFTNGLAFFREVVCDFTTPVGAECRFPQISQQALPPEVSCEASRVTCLDTDNFNCSDLEVRFLCARSRVFEFAQCSLRDVCSEMQPCKRGQCVLNAAESTFYTCRCPDGYEGSQCQREIDECLTFPVDQLCQNGGTCVDEFLGISCLCPQGFSGDIIHRIIIKPNYSLLIVINHFKF
ncbi:fibropellin-1 [Plakobranchus ocellatus]|uniref:Fibropellin-1 n=1 Tax=Plakobranchus ocellatus TaxID=259542 RepID=A0AAV4D453_9GAST|nr:fibropellin-1 [Plakobranchus ocellatus]